MQAEGDVIRFPAAEEAPPDFAAFFNPAFSDELAKA